MTNPFLTIITAILMVGFCNQKHDDSAKEDILRNDAISRNSLKKKGNQDIQDDIEISFTHIDPSVFINKTYRYLNEIEFFRDYSQAQGASIGSLNDISYCLSHYDNGNKHLIVLETSILRGDNKVEYIALDIIEITLLGKNTVDIGTCRKDEMFDREIFAIIELNWDEKFSVKTFKSWRADRLKGRIYEIESGNVDCINTIP